MTVTDWVNVVLNLVSVGATVTATLFALKAVRAAERTIGLELEAQRERGVQRKLDLLDRLLLCTYELEEAADRVEHLGLPATLAIDARGRYQVAFLAAEELSLPTCKQLSDIADVSRIGVFSMQAAAEIKERRSSLSMPSASDR